MCEPYQVYPFWFWGKLDVLQEPANTNKIKQKLKIRYQATKLTSNGITVEITL